MNVSPENNRFASLSFHQSMAEKSIINQLPDSIDFTEKISWQNAQIQKLKQALDYYKKQVATLSHSKNFPNIQQLKQITKTALSNDYKQLIRQAADTASFRAQNEQLKKLIKKLSQELRISKKREDYEHSLNTDYQQSLAEIEMLRNDNLKHLKYIQQLKFQLTQTKKLNQKIQNILTIQTKQLDKNDFNKNSSFNHLQKLSYENKIESLTQDLKYQNQAVRSLSKQNEQLKTNLQQIQHNGESGKTTKRYSNHLKLSKSASRMHVNIENSRSISELDLIDSERFALKLAEKNKEYEQLYFKYQSLQNQFNSLQEVNGDLERERKFLAEKLSDMEIHTQGDEVVGQLENRLVLMSTEVMRLGHLSRTKTQQTKELSLKLKQIIIKKQNLQKQMIERDKIILNYKQELRLMQMRMNERNMQDMRDSQGQSNQKISITSLNKQIDRINMIYKQKMEILKNSEIRNAILEEKLLRFQKQYAELQKQNKELLSNKSNQRETNTKLLNYEAEINHFKQININLKEQIRRYESRIYQIKYQKQSLQRQKQLLRQTITQMQQKRSNHSQQIRRINLKLEDIEVDKKTHIHMYEQKLIEKNNSIKKLEQKILSMQNQVNRNLKYKQDLPKYEQLIKEIQKLETSEMSLKLMISNFEQKVAMLAQENQRLTFMLQGTAQEGSSIQQLKMQIESKQKKIRDFKKDIDSYQIREAKNKQQIEHLRVKLREGYQNQRQYQALQFKIRQLTDQLDAHRTQLSIKKQEYDNLILKHQHQMSQKYQIMIKNEELKSKNNIYETKGFEINQRDLVLHLEEQIKKMKAEQMKEKYQKQELLNENKEQEEIYSTLSGQIQRLNRVLGQKIKDIFNYKREIDLLKHKIKTCEEALEERSRNNISSQKFIDGIDSKTKIQYCEGKIKNYELQIDSWKERFGKLKQTISKQEERISQLSFEKNQCQQKLYDFEYQISEKSENFKTIENSLKLTILQIKNSNERLEKSVHQIENHYINKLQNKQNELLSLKNQKRQNDKKIIDLQKQICALQVEFGSEIKEKNKYISNLTTNHSQTQETIDHYRSLKTQLQVKVALLSQQIQRLIIVKQSQEKQIVFLKKQITENDSNAKNHLKNSTANFEAIDVLSTEIDRLNSVLAQTFQKLKVVEKQRSLSRVKITEGERRIEDLQSNIKQYEVKITHMNQANHEKIGIYQQNIRQLKHELKAKVTQIKQINQELAIKNNQISQLKQKYIYQEHQRQNKDVSNSINGILNEMKILREGKQSIEQKMQLIIRQNEQLVSQLQFLKRNKNQEDQDGKMKIISNYENIIRNLKQQNIYLIKERDSLRYENNELNKISHEFQEKRINLESIIKNYQQKFYNLSQRLKKSDQKLRVQEQKNKLLIDEKSAMEHKLLSTSEEISRLQYVIKTKEKQIHKAEKQIPQTNSDYYNQNIKEKKGIFVIKQASQHDERSRSASGNGPQQFTNKNQGYSPLNDLEHKYQLLQLINKKITNQCECLRKKNVQYQFKMNKLKQEFDLINRLIQQYREQNDKLKANNKMLQASQAHRNNHHFLSPQNSSHSQFSSPQHSSLKPPQYQNSQFLSISQASNQIKKNEKQQNFSTLKNTLLQQIDRLNKVNSNLQSEIYDLRINSSDNVSLRKRLEENLSLMTIMFIQIESLRSRIKITENNHSPNKYHK